MTCPVSSAEIIALREAGVPVRDIAERCHMHIQTVYSRLWDPARGSRKRTFPPPSARCLEVVAAFRAHGTCAAAGAALGISPQAVGKAVAAYERRSGEQLPRNRWSDARRAAR